MAASVLNNITTDIYNAVKRMIRQRKKEYEIDHDTVLVRIYARKDRILKSLTITTSDSDTDE